MTKTEAHDVLNAVRAGIPTPDYWVNRALLVIDDLSYFYRKAEEVKGGE